MRGLWVCLGATCFCALLLAPPGAAEDREWERLDMEATSLYKNGEYDRALVPARKALESVERAFGPDHLYVAIPLETLALIYKEQGRYAEATPLAERSLALMETVVPDHRHVATMLDFLGDLYQAQGQDAAAEPLYKRALAIRERALAADHPQAGVSPSTAADHGVTGPLTLSLLDGREFALETDRIKPERRAAHFTHVAEPGSAIFAVADPKRIMQWQRPLDSPLDVKEWPVLLLQYSAERVWGPGELVLWLSDGPEGDRGYLGAVPAGGLTDDGESHVIRIDLSRSKCGGPLRSIHVFLRGGSEGNARLAIEHLMLLHRTMPAASECSPEGKCVARHRDAFVLDREIPVGLECPSIVRPVEANSVPLEVKSVEFVRKDDHLWALVRTETAVVMRRTFTVRLTLCDSSLSISFPQATREFTIPSPADLHELDFGAMDPRRMITDFDVQVEDVTSVLSLLEDVRSRKNASIGDAQPAAATDG